MKPSQKTPGRIKQVTALSNPIIKSIRGLAMKKNRDAEGLFIAEGLKLITDAVQSGWEISTLIYAGNISGQPQLQEVALQARNNGTDILEVSEKVLSAITRRDNPQMVVGIFKQNWAEMKQVQPVDGELWIGLDRVRDPGNLGTIIRTADCVGAKGVVLIGDTTDPWSLEAVRATMGSIFNIKLARCTSDEFVSWRERWHGMVVGTDLTSRLDYRQVEYDNRPVFVLMGNEQQGLPTQLVDLCSHNVAIPMAGKADSLNLAVATAIMVFEIRRNALGFPSQPAAKLKS